MDYHFISERFLLETPEAFRLYHEFARDNPIIDYHNHLSPRMIAEDHRFSDISEAWLSGDHYKWRLMRTNGIEEKYCTGNAPGWEKFLRWAQTLPLALGSPLFHWSQLELKRWFDIDEILTPGSARKIWDACNERLSAPGFSVKGLLNMMNIEILCTTDDPADTLEYHKRISEDPEFAVRVVPTFRPDKAMRIENPTGFRKWLDRLAEVSGIDIGTDFSRFLEALKSRHDFFHRMGCRSSDHSLETPVAEPCTREDLKRIFKKVVEEKTPDQQEINTLKSGLLSLFAEMNAEKGWAMQLHIGAMRDNCARLFKDIGSNIGCDSMHDLPVAFALSRFLDRLDEKGRLPRTILYNLNPKDGPVLAVMCGNFQDGTVPGKMQYGPPWWFLDNMDGIEEHLKLIGNHQLLGRFVGMLTDSRSFLSFPRHEYFRRILCNWLGRNMARGLIPFDFDLSGAIVRRICYQNAREYFRFDTGENN